MSSATSRLLLKLLNGLWYAAAATIVIVALLVAIGREMLPKIEITNPALLTRLEQKLAVQLGVTRLRSEWRSLYPSFSVDQLRLQQQGAEVELNQVRFEINWLQTVVKRTPVFNRLQVAEAHIALVSQNSQQALNLDHLYHSVYTALGDNIAIDQAAVSYQIADQPTLRLQLKNLRLRSGLFDKKISGDIYLNDNPHHHLKLLAELRGSQLNGATGQLYLRVDALDLQPHLMWLQHVLPAPWLTEAWTANGEAWLQWRGKDRLSATVNATIARPDGAQTRPQTLPQALALRGAANWQAHLGWQLQLNELRLKPKTDSDWLTLASQWQIDQPSAQAWHFSADTIDLSTFNALTDYLPAPALQEVMLALQPQGRLRHTHAYWNAGASLAQRFEISTQAEQLSTGAWHGVPAFTGVSGYIHSSLLEGYIQLDSQQGFSMHFVPLYNDALHFQTAQGQVQWQWLPLSHALYIGTREAVLSGEMGRAAGAFQLEIPLSSATVDGDLTLAIGLSNSHSRHQQSLVPTLLPESLRHWLTANIHEADVPQAGFFYRGEISHNTDFSHALQLFVDVENARLHFDPQWPEASAIQGRLIVDNDEVLVHVDDGKLSGGTITNTEVLLQQTHPGMLVQVRGHAAGSARQLVKVLTGTPLATSVGKLFAPWKIEAGEVSGDIALAIPVNSQHLGWQDVQLQLEQVDLTMSDLSLKLLDISGPLNYHSQHGLSSEKLSANTFGSPVSARIHSKPQNGELQFLVDVESRARVEDVARWSKLQPLLMASGSFDYQLHLAFNGFTGAKIGEIHASSKLQGVTLPLPAPLDKAAQSSAPLDLRIELFPGEQRYQIKYNNTLDGAVRLRDSKLHAGHLAVFDGAAKLPELASPLLISAALPQVELPAWQQVITRFAQLPSLGTDSTNAENDGNTTQDNTPIFAIRSPRVFWGDLQLHNVASRIRWHNQGWQVKLEAPDVNGSIWYPSASNQSIDVKLQQVRYTHKPGSDETATEGNEITANNALAQLDFSSVPAANIRIDDLVVNEKSIGSLYAELRSTARELTLENITMDGEGYQLRHQAHGQGAKIRWSKLDDGRQQTNLHGRLILHGPQPVLQHLGFDAFLTGEEILLIANLKWPNSPVDFTLPSLEGEIFTYGKNGQFDKMQQNPALQILNVLDLNNWVRRLKLDFRDLTNDKIAFESLKGKITFKNHMLRLSEPIVIDGSSFIITLGGQVNLQDEQLALQLAATLPVATNAAWVAGFIAGLPAAAGLYVASKIFDFDEHFKGLTSLNYQISGSLAEPNVQFQGLAPPPQKDRD